MYAMTAIYIFVLSKDIMNYLHIPCYVRILVYAYTVNYVIRRTLHTLRTLHYN